MGTEIEDVTEGVSEDASEEYDDLPKHTTALYVARGLYILAAACFVISLFALFNSITQVQNLLSNVTGLQDTLVQSVLAIREIMSTFLVWVITTSCGLLSAVIGLLVHSFVK